jgi:hypothetical protein
MKKTALLTAFVAIVALLPFFACGRGPALNAPAAGDSAPAPAAPTGVTAGWTATEGIATPESAFFDEASGFIFSSQIEGQPTEADGKGRIVKLTGDGKIVSATWVTGLNAPKGLRSTAGTLWVADIGEVVAIDIASGTISQRVKIPNAQFLNDVATGADGTVYVSDMMGNRIFAIKGGQVSVFAEGDQLEYPNGLLVDGSRLVVGAWGKPEADFTTKVPGRLYALDLQTKAKTLITPMPFGNIDGLESDGKGGYLVTDYLAGKLMRVLPSGESRTIQTFMPGTADIGFAAARGVVIVPHMNENKVSTYNVAPALN